MKVLVTGATGFLGGYVIKELLGRGYEVRAFGRNQELGQALIKEGVDFVSGDFTKEAEIMAACQGMDAVVHAGALSTIWGPWSDFYQANVYGTQLVLKACMEHGIKRLVYISSPSIYAAAKDQLGIKETDAPQENNLNNYIKSKLMAERLIKNCPQIPSIVLRPRGLFGIGDNSILPRVLAMSQRLGLPLLKGGQQLMDMTCVENVALAIALALEAKDEAVGQIYNITNGEPRTFKSLLDELLDGLGQEKRYLRLPAGLIGFFASSLEGFYRLFQLKKEPPLTRYSYYLLRYSQTLDISKAQEDLGYEPRMSLSEGIENYVKHYRES
ncbi:NAD-dependent epimerase/dehydratase family protein [Streptococcus oricebi]|uniref:NAD-dependent dehydratase n=1 Tax=Streptococcus oricebi TaxID=1547447 RepID=A0ABS5B6L8_9STRE|nr:NAD(P)-dependent oxidoreductase [Streptococcus oricebi]MBP2624153.1 NAD-dependent dehydratase [Streptococcus oricebi]